MKAKLIKEKLVDQTKLHSYVPPKKEQWEWSGAVAAYRWQALTPFLHKAADHFDIELIVKDRDKGFRIETIYLTIKGSKENIEQFMEVVEEAIKKG